MPQRPPTVTVEYSTRTKHVGIALSAVGLGLGLGSLLAFVAADNESHSCQSAALETGTGECDFSGMGGMVASVGLAVAGGVALLVGVPLIIVGATDVQVPATDPRAIEKLREQHASAVPELRLGAGSAHVTWRF